MSRILPIRSDVPRRPASTHEHATVGRSPEEASIAAQDVAAERADSVAVSTSARLRARRRVVAGTPAQSMHFEPPRRTVADRPPPAAGSTIETVAEDAVALEPTGAAHVQFPFASESREIRGENDAYVRSTPTRAQLRERYTRHS